MNYSLAIVTFDQRFDKYFKPLIQKIVSLRPDIEILVSVNGNYKAPQKENFMNEALFYMSKYNNIYPHFYTKFTSLSKLWNRSIQNSSNDMVLVLNDDVKIDDGFFDWIEKNIKHAESKYFIINRVWCHFLIDKNFLNSVNWFDERYLGIGWEDYDIARHKSSPKSLTCGLIHSFHNENLEKPAQEKIRGNLKYSKFNQEVYDKKWKNKKLPESKQYPYYIFEKENYDKLGE